MAASACAAASKGTPPVISSTELAWRARLLRVEVTRRDEPAFIDSLLASRDPRARAAAVLAVGRIGARGHLPTLRQLASDPDTSVQGSALFALGLLKDSTAASLAAAALHSPGSVAAEAAWLLGELGERGRAPIVSGLRDTGVSDRARGALLLAATRLHPVPADAVAPWLASRDTAIAWRAAYALARGRSAAGVRPLLALQSSPAAVVREQVARGLARAAAGDTLAALSQRALHALVADDAPHVRINAIRSSASYGADARPDVVGALQDPDANVRVAAAQALDLVLDTTAAAWARAFETDTAFVVQQAIALGAARHGVSLDRVAAWRNSPDWRQRASTVDLDAVGAAATAISRVERWTVDPDGRVRTAAAGALSALADSAASRDAARTLLQHLLADPDPDVRSAARAGLKPGAASGDTNAIASRGTPGTARPFAWYEARAREASSGAERVATIETERGVVQIALFSADAPLTVFNFDSLARAGYFDGQRFHRVVPNFVAQGGDPRGDGNGGPGYAIRDELNRRRYIRGTVGMALDGPNTGGSQFFITHSPQPHLDGGYTVFGQLLTGYEVLDRIVQGDRIVRITIQ